jgi:trans-2,3-dihydro-3-hydroxyanthranilate isomerase
MNPHRLFIVDVFAEEKYAGNQLAVVTQGSRLSDAEMQRIARETNFSETTFILSEQPRAGGYDVRIFTPVAEVPFAGHPTLGTAFVLRHTMLRGHAETVTLNLKAGRVPVTFEMENERERLWLQAPPAQFGPAHTAADVAAVVGLTASDVDDRFPVREVAMGIAFVMLPVRTLAAVQRARFDRDAFARSNRARPIPPVFLFCAETLSPENQVHARMFAEAYGVPEDPATGSATACFGAYVLDCGYLAGHRVAFRVEQGYEIGRPSLLFVRGEQTPSGPRVSVGGHVIPVFRGELM